MQILKHNQRVKFDRSKIRNAIIQSYNQIEYPDFKKIDNIVNNIEKELKERNEEIIPIQEVENLVMSYLYKELPKVAREYSKYKIDKERAHVNPTEIEEVLFVSPEIEHENGNKNPNLVHIKNAYLAEIPSRQMMRKLLPPECLDAHDRSVVYFNDFSYSARSLPNCCLWNLEEMFKGCKINNIYIETPKSFRTACTVASQAISHATNCQFGLI